MTEKTKGTAAKARQAMAEAAAVGDVKVVRAIGKTFLDLEDAKDKLKAERARWKDRIAAAEAALKGAIESGEDSTAASARSKLNSIVIAYQEVADAIDGKKAACGLATEIKKEVESRLKKQIEGAKQLGLFDDNP